MDRDAIKARVEQAGSWAHMSTLSDWYVNDAGALLDALEAAEAERDALAEVFEDSYPMAYTEWIEVRNAWKRRAERAELGSVRASRLGAEFAARAERAEALVSTLGDALETVTDELDGWGWGDFHYGEQPQEKRVVENVAIGRAALESFREFTERAPAPVIREEAK